MSLFVSSRTTDPEVVRHALSRGINYFDTAEGYKGGASEESMGAALAGRRNDVIIASKTQCGVATKRHELMTALEGSLRRLDTDRIDVYFNHAVNETARLENEEWFAFASAAKAQGKIRFTGMSGHGGNLVECIDHAVSNDLVDRAHVDLGGHRDALTVPSGPVGDRREYQPAGLTGQADRPLR